MSTRQQRISEANLRIVAKMNQLKTEIGNLPTLSTTNKSNLVAAINEVYGIATSIVGGAVINDSVTNTTNAWSSNKIDSEITAKIVAALEGEDLSDLAASITALAQADTGLVSAATAQSFTTAQKLQARTNIEAANSTEVGNTDFDFVAEINSALSF